MAGIKLRGWKSGGCSYIHAHPGCDRMKGIHPLLRGDRQRICLRCALKYMVNVYIKNYYNEDSSLLIPCKMPLLALNTFVSLFSQVLEVALGVFLVSVFT